MTSIAKVGLVLISLLVSACAAGPVEPAGETLGGKADCATCSKLHTTDRIRVASERENRRWGDRRLGSGTAWIIAGRLDDGSEDGIVRAAPQLLAEFYEDDRGGPTNGAAATGDVEFVDMGDEFALEEVAERVATEGFAYSEQNIEDRTYIRWAIQHTVDWLGDEDSDILSVTATDTYKNDDAEDDNVSVTVIANSETRKYVAVYVREGEF